MRYYPLNVDLHGRSVVIVGGGAVAARKARRLLSAGARVTVVSPRVDPAFAELAGEALTLVPREYRPGDLEGAALAFAATDAAAVNRAVADEARRRGILVDVVAAPQQGDFTTPALLERGDLVITVSTAGASPALSRRILKRLDAQFGPEYAEAVALLGAVRENILTVKGGNAYNERVFSELAELDLPALIKSGRRDVIDQILSKLAAGLGPGPDGAEKKDP